MEKFEVPFFSSWNETKFAIHQRLLHKETKNSLINAFIIILFYVFTYITYMTNWDI